LEHNRFVLIHSCLAWQKGQGVPQRYHKAQDQYQALILEIEMAERSFLDLENNGHEGGVKLDPRAEQARLQKLFDTARADQQANYPDSYVTTGAPPAAKAPHDLTKALEDAKAETVKVQGELMAKVEALTAKLANKVDTKVEDAIQDVTKI
jgi:ribonuclease D